LTFDVRRCRREGNVAGDALAQMDDFSLQKGAPPMARKFMLCLVLLSCCASVASAQTGTGGVAYATPPSHRFDLIPLGGYSWTFAQDAYVGNTVGEIDLDDAAFYGAALDINTMRRSTKEVQVRLLYRRSDSQVTFRPVGDRSVQADAAIEYWHIGGVGGYRRGKAMPFTAVSLGGSRLVAGSEDSWKFSMMFGLGVKYYASPKVGLMLQGNLPITFTDAWGGVTVGTGGAGLSVGGTGIGQIDVGGGVIICF
jgi:hypothetical protein